MEVRPVRVLLAIALLTVSLAGCIGTDGADVDPAAADEEIPGGGEAIDFEKIHAPDEIASQVHELANLSGVDAERIGTSVENRPIHLVTVGEGDFELWIVGRQHGNEPTGGEAILLAIQALGDPNARLPADAPAIVETFREHRETLTERITFHFVPVANPDGAAAYQRFTALGQDPNRDHFAFTHPFSRALREAFWERKPDACLDLHNEGIGNTDFDAFGAEGPLMEDENYDRAVRDANLTVREVDAAGGNAGSYNENYRAPAAEEYPNPTAFHPGTHDVFCTARGAPGWTPEGAIEGGDNGATDPVFEWSTRLHQVTIAASSLHWAGAYETTHPNVFKESGALAPAVEHTYTLDEPADLTLQSVWRQTGPPGDHSPTPVRFTVTTPSGETLEGRTPHPEAWTSTVQLPEAETGEYTLTLTAAPVGSYELRGYAYPATDELVTVERSDAGLTVAAAQAAPGPVEVDVTEVGDPADVTPEAFQPAAEEIHHLNGTVDERLAAGFELTLDPGETVEIEVAEALEARGPYRFTAASGDNLQTGIEDAFNPKPDG